MDSTKQVKKEILWCGLPSGGSDSKAEWARQEKARLRSKLESHHGFTQATIGFHSVNFLHTAPPPSQSSLRVCNASPDDPFNTSQHWPSAWSTFGMHATAQGPAHGAGMTLGPEMTACSNCCRNC